jgi:putative membrane protein insertion efficiency factor
MCGIEQKIMTKLLVSLIKGYQLVLSPFIGQQCRFTPTCSHYAIEALQTHGVVEGVLLALKRILRCHPWQAGGHDSVPK